MKLQIKRLIVQFIALFYANLGALQIKTGFCIPFFYCHACPTASSACPLRVFESSVYKGKFDWQFFLYPFLILGVFGITTGRAACGWLCPIGLLQRGTSNVARKFKKFGISKKLAQSKAASYAKYTKYFVLIGLVFVTTYLIGFMFTDICPIGFLTGTIPILILNPGKYIPNSFFIPALIIFILFLILIFTIERGWCRYFCPIGAFLAFFNKMSIYHVSVKKDECIHCNACSNVCPMAIDVPKMNRDPECILCGKCISTCPKSIIKYEGLR